MVGIKHDDIETLKNTEFPIMDRYSTGSQITKRKIQTAFLVPNLENIENKNEVKDEEIEILEEPEKKTVSLKEIDERLMTIDDFLNDNK